MYKRLNYWILYDFIIITIHLLYFNLKFKKQTCILYIKVGGYTLLCIHVLYIHVCVCKIGLLI